MDSAQRLLLDHIATLEERIAQITERLNTIDDPIIQEALTERRITAQVELTQSQRELATLTNTLPLASSGNVSIHGGITQGVVAGVVLGNIIYGRDPKEDEQRRLVRYLDRMQNVYGHLSLRGLAIRSDVIDVRLSTVYISLATDATRRIECHAEDIQTYIDTLPDGQIGIKPAFHPDWVLPETAIVAAHGPKSQPPMSGATSSIGSKIRSFFSQRHAVEPSRQSENWILERAELAVEAIRDERTLVLLGDPGGGKSVLLRYMAWQTATDGLTLSQQPGKVLRLPLFIPLRHVAGAIARAPLSPVPVITALFDTYARERIGSDSIDDGIREALTRGAALVLFDGLDEVPLSVSANIASRATVSEAIAQFARLYPKTTVIVTCRLRAFDDISLRILNWPVRVLAPFTLGQIRHFLTQWYGELQQTAQFSKAQTDESIKIILAAIKQHDRLHDMATSPLLLTLMAQIVYNAGDLPRDRPLLYEKMLELLLGEWDKVNEGEDLAEILGAGWDSKRIRRLIDELSYEAHRDASSSDGRGRLKRSNVRNAMIDYFEKMSNGSLDAWQAAQKCLNYIEQRSGLLIPYTNDDYVFAHLTFQEHCAGRYLLTHRDAKNKVMKHRNEDRWREPIFLGIGVIQEHNPALISIILSDLVDREENETLQPKTDYCWYRDILLAAEIGDDRDWKYLQQQGVDTGRLQRDIRRGLVALLSDHKHTLSIHERLRASVLLGRLGDVRIPVTLDDWRHEISRTINGDETGYFCRIPAGTYIIGSSDEDFEAEENERPQHRWELVQDVWMARYPFTNQQWEFLAAHTPLPRAHTADEPTLNLPNQPVVGVNWKTVMAGLAWMSHTLGVILRLPTEREWEAAARGSRALRYPWGHNWRDDVAATAKSQSTSVWHTSMPVGCFPAGASPFGVCDMAGNVWEWCFDDWKSYLDAPSMHHQSTVRGIRGGSYAVERTHVRGARRIGSPADQVGADLGFRMCLMPGGMRKG